MLGLSIVDYCRLFTHRRNLLSTAKWSAPLAREAANRLRGELAEGDALVLLGARVAKAFGYDFVPLAEHRGLVHGEVGYRALIVPHPSGRSRQWNDKAMAGRVREAVARLSGPAAPGAPA